jgi:hypothetical protein
MARYAEYREHREGLHKAWLERKKEREEKMARGEEVGPEEPDPTAEREIGVWGVVKGLIILVVAILLAGKFFTDSYLWEYQGKWVKLKTYLPVRLLFSNPCAVGVH